MTYATPEYILYAWSDDALLASEEPVAPPDEGGGDDPFLKDQENFFPIEGWQPTNPTGGSGGHRLWH